MNPDSVKNAVIELSHQFVPNIPKKSLLRPLSGRIYSHILTKTEDQNLSFFKKIALKVNFIWCVLFIPMDMAWNIILIPITFICIPIKYTFRIDHKFPGVKKWLEEIKMVFVCIIEIGILPMSVFVPARWLALVHHKLRGCGYTIKSTPSGYDKDDKPLNDSISRNNSRITTPISPSSSQTLSPRTLELIPETLSPATEFQPAAALTPPTSPPLSPRTSSRSSSSIETETEEPEETTEIAPSAELIPETLSPATEFQPAAARTPPTSPLLSPRTSSSSSSSVESETEEPEEATGIAPLAELIPETLSPATEFQPDAALTPPTSPPLSPRTSSSSSSSVESETEEPEEAIEIAPSAELIPETLSPATEFQPTAARTPPTSPPLSPRTSSSSSSSVESETEEPEETTEIAPSAEPIPEALSPATEFQPAAALTPPTSPPLSPRTSSSSFSSVESETEEPEETIEIAPPVELIPETLSPATEFEPAAALTPPTSPPLSPRTSSSSFSSVESETEEPEEAIEIAPSAELIPETLSPATEFQPAAALTPPTSPPLSPRISSRSSSSVESETEEPEETTEIAPSAERISELLPPEIEFQPTPVTIPPSSHPSPSTLFRSSSFTQSSGPEANTMDVASSESASKEFSQFQLRFVISPDSSPLSSPEISQSSSIIDTESRSKSPLELEDLRQTLERELKRHRTNTTPLSVTIQNSPSENLTNTSSLPETEESTDEDLPILRDLANISSFLTSNSVTTNSVTYRYQAQNSLFLTARGIPESTPTNDINTFLQTAVKNPPQQNRRNEPKCLPSRSPSESLSDSQLFASNHLNESTVASSYLMPNNSSPLHSPNQSPAGAVTSLSGSGTLTNEQTWTSNHDGTGPTFVGQVLNVGTTATNLIYGACVNYLSRPQNNFEAKLNNPGTQLDSQVLQCYFTGLIEALGADKAYLISDFYTSDAFGIAQYTPETLERQLGYHKRDIKPGQAIIIPLVLPGPAVFERNHIVTVLIKDGTMEYYDSKGIVSQNTTLQNGASLTQLLNVIKKEFLPSLQGGIKENTMTHQSDANNCGAFVAKYIYDRLYLNRTFRDICSSNVPDIWAFRREMLPFVQRGHVLATSY